MSPGNVVRLIAGTSGTLPPDPNDILYSVTAGASGSFASTPIITPHVGTTTNVFVGIDENQNGALDTSERTHALALNTISFTAAKIGAKRTSGPAAEGAHYTIQTNEHMEIGGTFDFALSAGSGTVVGYPSLIRAEVWSATSGGDPFDRMAHGPGLSITDTLDPGTSESNAFIRFYADANDNDQCDPGEARVNSSLFLILQRKTWVLSVEVSSKIAAAATPAAIAAAFLDAEILLLKKDSETDFRSAVEFQTTVTPFTATPDGGARPDPVLNDAEEQGKHFNAASDFVFVEDLRTTGVLGLCRNHSWHEILIEWDPIDTARLAVVIAHEFGHGLGFEHSAGDNVDDPPRIMSAIVAGTGYNEVSQQEADDFD